MQTQIILNSHLTSQEKQNPASVYDSFFDYYDLGKAQAEVQALVQVALTTDNDIYDSGSKRSNLLHLQQYLLKIIEAGHILTNVPA